MQYKFKNNHTIKTYVKARLTIVDILQAEILIRQARIDQIKEELAALEDTLSEIPETVTQECNKPKNSLVD